MEYQTRVDLARQTKLLSGNTAIFGGSIELGEDLTAGGTIAFIGLKIYTGDTRPRVVVIDYQGKLYEGDAFPAIDDKNISTGTTYSSDKIISLTGTKLYNYYQDILSDTWEIPHNLGGYCFIQVYIAGIKVETNIKHLNPNNSLVTFSKPQVGLAICII